MSSTWEYKPLGDLLVVQNGYAFNSEEFSTKVGMPLIRIRDIKEGITTETNYTGEYDAKFIVKNGDLLIGMDGEFGCYKWKGSDALLNQRVCRLQEFSDDLVPQFLLYGINKYLKDIEDVTTFTTVKHLSSKTIKEIEFPVPPKGVQQRIVTILDEAFAGIATATANAEKNLQNARELFNSYLHSLSYETKSLGALVEIKTGKLNANAAVEGGEYPFFTCSREVSQIDTYAFDCEAILLAGNNASGDFNVKHHNGKFNAYQRTYVITVKNDQDLLYRYLYYQMLKGLKDLKESSVGAGTKFLKLGMIQNFQIALPNIAEQKEIVEKLDQLSVETKRLEGIYAQKLHELAELKQSLLQKAFAGELH